MNTPSSRTQIELLANHKHLIAAIGELRWREWGHAPEPEDRDWWVEVTAHEAGLDQLPITWVAINENGEAVGAVGLGEFDIEERQNRSPWILGMIVRPDFRARGIGRRLLAKLEGRAKEQGYKQLWVANEGPALNFYQKCGWRLIETFERSSGESIWILTKNL
jgi:GNAT superfamily N-acetyltransferase